MSLRRSVWYACLALVPGLQGCELFGAILPGRSDEIAGIGITFGFSGHVSHGFLTVGSRDTVRATAGNGGWPARTIYDSTDEPRRFTYTSSNPNVAAVDLDGVVTARSPGTTDLGARIGRISSPPLLLTVLPAAASISAEPNVVAATVGETFSISIDALDINAQPVSGVMFNVGVDTTHWAVTTVPAEGDWMLSTPIVLHLTGRVPGRVRVIAATLNERPEFRFKDTVSVTVRAP